MKQRITQKLVEGIEPDPKGDLYIGDDGVTGFRLKVTPAGRRVFYFQYRAPDGKQRKLTLGTADTMDVARARSLATDAANRVRKGEDPQSEADQLAVTPSLEQAFNLYDQMHIMVRCKPGTGVEYRRMFKKYVPATVKGKPITHVERPEIVAAMRELRDKPYQANHLRAMLRGFFSWCEGDGALLKPGQSPAHGIKAFPSQKRSFVFEGDQLYRFREALDKGEGTMWPPAISAMRLLLFTGMRKEEVINLKWREVDFEGRRIKLEDSKTGARPVPLGKDAIAILEKAKANAAMFASEYVFPAPSDRSKPIAGFDKMWRKLRKAAGLPNLRVHDLRHNFGGMAAASTRSAVHVKGLLGHTQIGTTDRYMKLAEHPLQEAADATNDAIAEAMQPANVVSIGGRR